MNKKWFKIFLNNRILVLTIFLGAALVGYTTGNVLAQEVRLGSTAGTPTVSFEDALKSGMYEIRLNDGTGEFQIWDITNSRNAMIVGSNGNIGVGGVGSTAQDFTIGCGTGLCSIQTRAFDGTASNEVKSLGGAGVAKFRIVDDVTSKGSMSFEIRTFDDGTVCMGDPTGDRCMLKFDIKGPNPGRVTQIDGTCIANCS